MGRELPIWGHATAYLVGSELWHAATTDQGDDLGLTEHLCQANASGEVWRE